MRKDQRTRLRTSRSAIVATATALAFATCLATIARGDDLKALGNIGDAHKSVRLITHYDIHPETKTFDLTAATPSGSGISEDVQRQAATETAHDICADGRVSRAWTVRMFMPSESTPVATCRFGKRH